MIEAFAADKGIRLIANSPTTKLLQLLPQPPLARLDQLNVCMRSAALSEVTSSVLSPFCKPCVPMLRSVSAEIFTYHTPFWLFNLWTPGRHHRYGLSRRLPKINGPMWGVCNGLLNKDTFRIRWGNASKGDKCIRICFIFIFLPLQLQHHKFIRSFHQRNTKQQNDSQSELSSFAHKRIWIHFWQPTRLIAAYLHHGININ